MSVDNQLQAVEQHEVDALCAAVTVTLGRREQVDFSLPIFPGGVGVVVRSDAPKRLRNILNGEATQYTPTWKAIALNILREQVFTAVAGHHGRAVGQAAWAGIPGRVRAHPGLELRGRDPGRPGRERRAPSSPSGRFCWTRS